jgi:Tol biopolymer transport system component
VSGASQGIEDRVLALADTTGRVEKLNVPPKAYLSPRFSPDGRRVAVQTTDASGSQIWVYDLSGAAAIRQLTQAGNNIRPAWTPDGERLAFASDRDGTMSIYWQAANGRGVAERLTTAEEGTQHWPESWTPDGRTLSFSQFEVSKLNYGIWTISADGNSEPKLFYDLPDRRERLHQLSPNGRWVVYSSTAAGPAGTDLPPVDIYVQPFPATGEVHQITLERGAHPAWSRDGRQLYFRSPGVDASGFRPLMMLDITTDGGVAFGNVRRLPIEGQLTFNNSRDYDISPDGQRFVIVTAADLNGNEDTARPKLNIVLNWFEELKRRAPAGKQ